MTEEAASVLAWYEHYARVCEDPARATRPSFTTLQLLQLAFPVQYSEVVERRLALGADEWLCVVALLEAFFEVELDVVRGVLRDEMTLEEAVELAEFVHILEYVVCAVVQCDNKARFVRDILTMDDNVQVDIMAVIERVMIKTASMTSTESHSPEQQNTGAIDEADTLRTSQHEPPASPLSTSHRDLDVSMASTTRSPLHSTRNAELERLKRENDILKQDSAHVAADLADAQAKVQQIETENANLRRSVEELRLQNEMDVLKKERAVRSMFDERLHTLQHQLDTVTAELVEKSAVAKDVNELRDEVDLLRPAAEKLAKAEGTLAKYKQKIEELGSAKEKLRRIEEANAELVEKNLALENQVAKTSSVQRKLAESKEANTAIQFRLSELEAHINRLTSDLEVKRTECEVSSAALAEARALNQQLQHSIEQQAEGGITGTIPTNAGAAGGISELNPELMEKLARLEYENIHLRSQVDGTTSERIESLIDDLDDANRMKKSFETKYFDTCTVLEETNVKLAASELRAMELASHLEGRNLELEAMAKERDDLKELAERNAKRIAQLTVVVDEKRTEIETLKNEVMNNKETHKQAILNLQNHFESDKEQLFQQQATLQAEFDEYIASHGVLNEEALAKERALQEELVQVAKSFGYEALCSELSVHEQVRRLHEVATQVQTRIEAQQTKLRDAVKTQLETNRKLMAVNQAIRNELAKKEAQVIQLENAVTRLDSKVMLYERERAHFSSEASGAPRDSDRSTGLQMGGHAQELFDEFEKARKEIKELRDQRAQCQCSAPGNDQPHAIKSYLQERVRQLELARSHEEAKKRELLLVNAKLMQDQQQLQAKNSIDSKEVLALREKLNTWMLRDERRRKEHEQFSAKLRALEEENKRLRTGHRNTNNQSSSRAVGSDVSPPASQEVGNDAIARAVSVDNFEQENVPLEDAPCERDHSSSPTRVLIKRKLNESADDGSETVVETSETDPDPEPLMAAPMTAPRTKRRMSHFFSNRMMQAAQREPEENPSECQQQ